MAESSHQPSPNHVSLRNRLIATGAAFVLAHGAIDAAEAHADGMPVHSGARIAQAEFDHLPSVSTALPTEKAGTATAASARHENGSENAKLPEAVRSIMERDTVYLEGLGCSGKLIRNKKDKVVGVLTAEHCSLTNAKSERIEGSNGKTYIVQPTPVRAQTGRKLDHLKTVATIDRFVVPGSKDTTHDMAFGVAKGHSPREVINAFKEKALTKHQVRQLQPGEPVYMSGWPQYQPDNLTLTEERQSFAMNVLTTGTTTTTEGKRLDVVWTTVRGTKDGASCSFGASGSEGFVMVDGQERAIGTLSVFIDLTNSVPGVYGASATDEMAALGKHNVVALCGFTYEAKTPDNGGTVLHATRTADTIPGYTSPAEADTKARRIFKNPNISKMIINGTVIAPSTDFAQGMKGGSTYLENPVLYHNAKHHYSVLEWADPNQPHNVGTSYIADKNIDVIAAYAHDGSTGPVNFLATNGAVTYEAALSGQTDGDFTDAAQQHFGAQLNTYPNITTQGYSFTVDKQGQLHAVALQSMK